MNIEESPHLRNYPVSRKRNLAKRSSNLVIRAKGRRMTPTRLVVVLMVGFLCYRCTATDSYVDWDESREQVQQKLKKEGNEITEKKLRIQQKEQETDYKDDAERQRKHPEETGYKEEEKGKIDRKTETGYKRDNVVGEGHTKKQRLLDWVTGKLASISGVYYTSSQQDQVKNPKTRTEMKRGNENEIEYSSKTIRARSLLVFHSPRIIVRREATPEPESTSEPEPETITEPEGSPNGTSEPEPELWPEPEPEWDAAKQEWRAAWPAHVIGFAVIFGVLAVVSLGELVRVHVSSQRKPALKISLLVMISVFCFMRTIALSVNAYNSSDSVNHTFIRIIFSLGHPCIISAISLLLLVLIDTTKMNVAPPTFQRVHVIVAVVVVHVVLVFVTDFVVGYYAKSKVLILLCQIYYIITGLSLSIGYARVGWKIHHNSAANISQDNKMQKLKISIATASVIGVLIVALTIYGAAGVFGIYSDVTYVSAWPWWGFQTAQRMLEVGMVILLLFMNIRTAGSRAGFVTSWKRRLFGANKVLPHTNTTTVQSMTT
ncbi:uncharacterized protein LOC5507420 isoform X1 [Nematostella vectensis]|uniref:uncharacterized protein LOC5507420 isoform X1 n=2 Tax=Nematostella vectensis TaxID=45351 RepID=UPI002077579F|nr:uncharacterized protein LOC5507420 isoform X1 [Nematostella vectensis]